MAVICPAILAEDLQTYNRQLAGSAGFAKRLHMDFMDGSLTTTKSPSFNAINWPKNVVVDVHLMYKTPHKALTGLIKHKPSLVIVHAEADGNFVEIAKTLRKSDIKAGVALLPKTPVDTIQPALEYIDHLLVFSGNLGKFGGKVDPTLMDKAEWCKEMKPELEVSWDGGVNDHNALELVEGGVDVLNVGGFIQQSKNPKESYQRLQSLLH